MSERLVVASAGTYHLPFQRLSAWMQRWLDGRTDVGLVMQHGPSSPVRGADNHEILPYAELLELCRRADAVVLQGGAGGVMDMRALGVVPIVVPRVPGGGEVVDEHQLVFTAEMARLGVIRRASSFPELCAQLDAALDAPAATPDPVPTPGVAAVGALLAVPPRPLPWPLRLRRLARVGRGLLRARSARP